MNIRGLINQVTARGAGAGRPARGPGAAPMGGAGTSTAGPAGPGSPAESTGARVGGMVGRMFNRRGRRP